MLAIDLPVSRPRLSGEAAPAVEAAHGPISWPRRWWTEAHYREALHALADLHATWWGLAPLPASGGTPGVLPDGDHMESAIVEARAALAEMEGAPWGSRFLLAEEARAWLRVLDNPAPLLETLASMPQTLVHAECRPYSLALHDGFSTEGRAMGPGPAPYDLACFYSSSRWWFGHVPLSLTGMRNVYLRRLNERLERPLDRYAFDAAFDTAVAWRFATLWPPAILEYRTSLMANLHHLRATVIDPAGAALRRSLN